ncbi:MAG: hypothetical protein M0C28_27300 [Candidatus Moduliflexus flocculans]|nr:hypothetical protein [Candidatus Moduliflexus flocculans]
MVKLNSTDFLAGRPDPRGRRPRRRHARGRRHRRDRGERRHGRGRTGLGLAGPRGRGRRRAISSRTRPGSSRPFASPSPGWEASGRWPWPSELSRDGLVDLVSLSRPLIRDPFLVKHFREGLAARSECSLLQQVFQSARHPLRRAREKIKALLPFRPHGRASGHHGGT